MNLLVLDQRAEEYKKALVPKFPEVVIHAATKEEEAEKFIEQADALFTFRVSDQLIKRASKLKWIHAGTTGVDYIVNLPSLRKDIIITSTRGIHGPQVSEMAFLKQELVRSRSEPGQRGLGTLAGKTSLEEKSGDPRHRDYRRGDCAEVQSLWDGGFRD
jgi:hypothetical protein